MADDKKYTIISVSADDEDEFVIQAGIPAKKEAGTTEMPATFSIDAVADAGEVPQKAVSDEEAAAVVGDDPGSLPPDASPTAAARLSKQERIAAEVEELKRTEEDINSVPPMSKMQKTILAAIAVFVVAALVYYFVCIR
ncbi:MAG: hypothetical protein RRX88_03415 [Raoultibacter sp.]